MFQRRRGITAVSTFARFSHVAITLLSRDHHVTQAETLNVVYVSVVVDAMKQIPLSCSFQKRTNEEFGKSNGRMRKSFVI